MAYINGCYNIGNMVTGYVGSNTIFEPVFGGKGLDAKDKNEKATPEVIKFGPYGSNTGTEFDDIEPYDKELVRVKKLIIFSENDFIKSFQIEYEIEGMPKWSKHGDEGGKAYPPAMLGNSEILTSMTVCVGKNTEGTDDVVTSLTFKTNLGNQFGPYGIPSEIAYTSPPGIIIGFFGRYSEKYVNQIGAYFL